jgi:hypothetical protein
MEGIERLLPVDLGVHLFELGGQILLLVDQGATLSVVLPICLSRLAISFLRLLACLNMPLRA